MTTPTEDVQKSAARALWRADLLRLDAAERRRIINDDQSPTGLALAADAASKEDEATIHMDLAEAEVRLSKAKVAYDVDPSEDNYILKRAAAQALVELRGYWRGIGEYLGTRRGALTIDHFPEPTDEEVLASHGGNV